MKRKQVYIGGFKSYTQVRLPKTGVFIAHDFFGDDDTKREGYREKFNDAFIDTDYMAVYAPIQSGTILETLTQSLVNCDAGIFDVTTNRKYNANVLLELGVALGLNIPSLIIAEDDGKPLLDFLEPLNPLRYKRRRDLIEQLPTRLDSMLEVNTRLGLHHCVICGADICTCRKNIQQEDKAFMLIGKNIHEDEVDIDVLRALQDFQLKRLEVTKLLPLMLCDWLHTIRRSRFLLFYSQSHGKAHHGEENAETMVQLGMAAGVAIPWRIIIPTGDIAPTDASAYMSIMLDSNPTISRGRISTAASVLLGEFNPDQGKYDPLEPPVYVEDEDTLKSINDLPQNDIWVFMAPDLTEVDISPLDDELDLSIRALLNDNEPQGIYTWQERDGLSRKYVIAMCHDVNVQGRFKNGVLWVKLGSNPDVTKLLLDLIEKLTGARKLANDVSEANEIFQTTIQDLSLLIVLEGVQNDEDTHPFLVQTPTVSYISITNSNIEENISQHVFISYDRYDTEFVERLSKDLNRRDIITWRNSDNSSKENDLLKTIDEGLEKSYAVINILTQDEIYSKWTRIEVSTAREVNIPVIPIQPYGHRSQKNKDDIDPIIMDTNAAYLAGLEVLVKRLNDIRHHKSQPKASSTKKIFISYVRRDSAQAASQLYQALVNAGFNTFIDFDITLGSDFTQVLKTKVFESDIFLCLISPNAIQSEWWVKELEWAFEMGKYVIPVIIDEIPVEFYQQIPSSIDKLSYIQSLLIRSASLDVDLVGLIEQISRLETLLTKNNSLSETDVSENSYFLVGRIVEVYKELTGLLQSVIKVSQPNFDSSPNKRPQSFIQLWYNLRKSSIDIPVEYNKLVQEFSQIRNELVHEPNTAIQAIEINKAIDNIQPVREWLQNIISNSDNVPPKT